MALTYGRNRFFVGWVPNRQNRSPTDEMAPSPPQSARISHPSDTWDPKQGSLGPHSACNQIWAAGISPRTAPRPGKATFWRFWPVAGPERAAKISPSLPDPLKPANRGFRPQEAKPLEVAVVRKLRNGLPLPMSQKLPEKSPAASSYGQKTSSLGGGEVNIAPPPSLPPSKPNQWCKPIGT